MRVMKKGSGSSIDVKTTKLEPIKNMEAWRDMGLGLFIHWGVYAVPAGDYTGLDTTGASITYNALANNSGSEWILKNARIPQATYKAYQSGFTASNWDADAVARMAYNAGLKYIVLTAKHHEGFCLFTSPNSEWNISTSAAAGKELIMPLKQACAKYGLKFGLYFSQNYDWTSVGGFYQGFISSDGVTDPYTTAQHQAYISKTILLINDIMATYSPDIFWYDILGSNDPLFLPVYQNQLATYPNVIVTDRLGAAYPGDYATGEDKYYQGTRKYAEDCYTVGGSWGYSTSHDSPAKTKTTEVMLKRFILEALARGQNALINISPKADGSIPDLQKNFFDQLGAFCNKYGTMFNSRSVNSQCQPQWGRMISVGKTLLCYVYKGAGTTIQIHGIHTRYIKSVRVFDAASEYASGNYSVVSDTILQVSNLVYDSTTGLAVVAIDFANTIVSDDINYVTQTGGITALAFNVKGSAFVQPDGTVYSIGGWTNDADYLETIFLYTGTTGSYKIKYTYTTIQSSSTITVTPQLTALDTSAVQSVTINKTSNPDDTSTGTVTLTNGKYYKLKVSKANGWINFTGIQFV
ncbi:alpha-L-fucosidase [Paenibacillus sp. BK033]|uniref:alpha-L-fucosidase n=1 Tax=Paenibacillus sp. BK033 TaxID=2512133 RepID=UPI001047F55B|nr:alpha-L-fucosidase [Paenibacillus sp. BK033]TCM89593.1 alpha-L-fucosidase [Paenibacillus sp. BK033]